MTENRLAGAGSPYLQQHADNPVHWQPWDQQALALARQLNRPILLSIGYSACHWCHVMAHESFEDEQTAGLMNRLFVNIKVDREERPDLDKIYQSAFQLMNNQAGGWPLTVFLTPDDQMPFFCGTYFPPGNAFGRPAFSQVLSAVADAWETREADIREQNQRVLQALNGPEQTTVDDVRLDETPLMRAADALVRAFHRPCGGFSGSPKFPHPDMLRLCLQNAVELAGQEHRQQAMEMLETTVRHMAFGGINDLVAGGFCRYSTDDQWMIPHFEKMLYDNGPLLALYADLYRYSANPLYLRVVRETAQWLITEMQLASGGFAASLDADSEGGEGFFYTWDRNELENLLSTDEYAFLVQHAGLDRDANFEGRWHLHVDAQQQTSEFDASQLALLQAIRGKLQQARAQRQPPGRDDKVLVSWNALAIKGLAAAYRVSNDSRFLEAAEKALGLIREHMFAQGRLYAVFQHGQARLSAYLDDHAFLIDALLTLLQLRWKSDDLKLAVSLAEVMLRHYQDHEQGGFYFTADDHEQLVNRPRSFADEAMPSGNGIAVQVLQQLGYLLSRPDFLRAAEATLQVAWKEMSQYPHAHCSLLIGLRAYTQPPQTLIIRGRDADLSHWQRQLQQGYHPRRQVFAIPADADDLPAALADKVAKDVTCAYVCEGLQCLPAVTDLQQLTS